MSLVVFGAPLSPFVRKVRLFAAEKGFDYQLENVNPFNQPGVESYKKNMFALLGKPGYEGEKEALEARLSK